MKCGISNLVFYSLFLKSFKNYKFSQLDATSIILNIRYLEQISVPLESSRWRMSTVV